MVDAAAVGFIGLGVMGEPMCRNLARRSGRTVFGFDKVHEPLARLAADGVVVAQDPQDLADRCKTILLSLPNAEALLNVCRGEDGLLSRMRSGQTLVDMSTSPVQLTRALASEFAERGVSYADAPIARTRQAAEEGTLAIYVGAEDATFRTVQPLLACMGADVTHCGPVGSGQVVKLLNNMVLIENVVAISEALAIGAKAGVNGQVLFEAISQGSGDSFALRNHGMKSVLPGAFPERAFSARYARKDLAYALELADQVGVAPLGAQLAESLLSEVIEQGDGELYWPVISRVVAGA